MRTNARIRSRFAKRIAPDSHIESVVFLQKANKGPTAKGRGVLYRYKERYGLTNALAPQGLLDNHWCVITENRVLLFAKRSMGIRSTRGPLEHALDRTDVSLQWADFTEGLKLRMRLIHLTTGDLRMLVAQTMLGSHLSESNFYDEADLFVEAFGDNARRVDLADVAAG